MRVTELFLKGVVQYIKDISNSNSNSNSNTNTKPLRVLFIYKDYMIEKDYKLEYFKLKRKQLLAVKKSQANKNNILFDLREEDVVYPDVCPILGIPLEHGDKILGDSSPTIDRINPSLGYTRGNIQVISLLANRMKNSANPEQLLKFADWVYKTYGDLPLGN